jgi:hypothetical protein
MLGVGLPVTGTFSNVNIRFEFGKKRKKTAGLVQQNYANISIGFSLRWFEKSSTKIKCLF